MEAIKSGATAVALPAGGMTWRWADGAFAWAVASIGIASVAAQAMAAAVFIQMCGNIMTGSKVGSLIGWGMRC
ncbi:hypothetical protein LP420_38335 [Massilia sp. B-10]|nr:hypothetical protein LP420_38335 [Massilia sp. B-10]UUZ57535.1 hypothetical protein LP419_37775 [Massilia sp. H-1]